MDKHDNNIESLIGRYFEGKASEEEIAFILTWVKKNDDNLHHFFKLRNIWYNVNPPFDIEEIDIDDAELHTLEMAGLHVKRSSWIRKFISIWSRVAAILLIPIIGVAIYFAIPTEHDVKQAGEVKLSTTFGCNMETDLPDGSHVWINSNSTIAYSSDFGRDIRRVRLEGEAFFKVKSDKENPFLVETHDLTVRATGTEFNVNAYPDYKTDVTLANGIVNVTVGQKGYRLTPGENLTLDNGRTDITRVDDMERLLAWRHGRLIFDGESLDQLMNRISQIYNIDYTIEDSTIATIPYRASFQGENISEIIRILEISSPIICEVQELPDENGPRHTIRISKHK